MAPRRITGKAGDPVQLLAPRHKGEKENNMFETYYNESVKYDAILKNGKTVNLGIQRFETSEYTCGIYEYDSSGNFSERSYKRGKYDGEYYERHDEEIESILENYGQGYQVYHPNVKKLDFRSFLCGKETHDTPIIRKILSWAGIQENDVLAFLFTTRYEEFSTIHIKVQISTKELSLFTFFDEEHCALL